MPSLVLLAALLFNLKGCLTQATQTAKPPNKCCPMRTVAGKGPKSGTYNLKDEHDPRCLDGCLYSKGDLNVCFRPNPEYLASCDQVTTTTTKALTYVDYWQMDKTLFSPRTISDSGEWGDPEFCPEGAYATKFQLYIAQLCTARCKRDDDVALMGIKLFCADYNDPTNSIAEISSSIMSPCKRGNRLTCDWMTVIECPEGQFTSQSRYLSEYFHDSTTTGAGAAFVQSCPVGIVCRNETTADSDPMGGLNMDMMCTDGTELIGDGVMPEQVPLVDGSSTTFWSDWTSCPDSYAICGIRSKVHQGETDNKGNLGQTEVLFHCCQLPPGFAG
eukprot:GFUD01105703.1.p1 GENE.GFUD01105703.1~~GFUD01105703.1.p1  ORF type:complete len:330 (+),score=45.75 GFUD01105703.1:140-1129(+)